MTTSKFSTRDWREAWDLEAVDTRLHRMIANAYHVVRQTEKEAKVDVRTAAYMVALRRLERVHRERGIFP